MSEFRSWLRNIWLDNCDEHDLWNEPHDSMEVYFKKYKYWLKREFRYQQQQEKLKNQDSNFAFDVILNDKLDYTGATLLSKSQNRLLKTLKDNNEK
jgi:Na+-transporting NADH:ubiquinone oxidoreductase subunit NqrF